MKLVTACEIQCLGHAASGGGSGDDGGGSRGEIMELEHACFACAMLPDGGV